MERHKTRRYEFPALVAIAGALSLFLMNALQEMRAEFEKTTVQSEAAALRVSLLDRLAHHQSVGGPLPQSKNPVVWAGYLPGNYRGERDGPSEEAGIWYYDTRRQELIYRYRAGNEARFRLARGAETANAAGSLGGIGLLRVD